MTLNNNRLYKKWDNVYHAIKKGSKMSVRQNNETQICMEIPARCSNVKWSLVKFHLNLYSFLRQLVSNEYAIQITFKNFSPTSASNDSLLEWKIALFHKKNFRSKSSDRKMPISDFPSQFSTSKIIGIFLNFFFIEEYQFRGMFFVIDIF